MLPGSYPQRRYMVCMLWNIKCGDEKRCYRCGTNKRPITEDRASQPMEAGGWVSQCENNGKLSWFQAKEWKCGAAALPFIFGRTRQHWAEIFPDSATISSLNIIQHNKILHTTIQDNTVDITTNYNRKGSPPLQTVQCFSTLFKRTLNPSPLVLDIYVVNVFELRKRLSQQNSTK